MYVNGKLISLASIGGRCNGVGDILIGVERVTQNSLAKVVCIISRRGARYRRRRIVPHVGSTGWYHIASHGGIEGVESITGTNAKGSSEIADDGFWFHFYGQSKRISRTSIGGGSNREISSLGGALAV